LQSCGGLNSHVKIFAFFWKNDPYSIISKIFPDTLTHHPLNKTLHTATVWMH